MKKAVNSPWGFFVREKAFLASSMTCKGCEQSLGIFREGKSFFSFLYDVFLGIRVH